MAIFSSGALSIMPTSFAGVPLMWYTAQECVCLLLGCLAIYQRLRVLTVPRRLTDAAAARFRIPRSRSTLPADDILAIRIPRRFVIVDWNDLGQAQGSLTEAFTAADCTGPPWLFSRTPLPPTDSLHNRTIIVMGRLGQV